ncbi:MAG: lysostaphin resistance A-like protein [Haloarculaceae archaeon]
MTRIVGKSRQGHIISRYPFALGPRGTAIFAVLVLLAMTLVGQVILQSGVAAALGAGPAADLTAPPVVLGVLVAGQLVLLGAGWWAATRWLSALPIRVPSGGEWRWLVGALGVNYVLFGLSRVATGWLGVESPPDVLTQAAGAAPWLLLVVAVLSIVLIGPAEETFYRGAIQGRFQLAFGPIAAILGAGLLFALPHMLNYVLVGSTPLAPGAVIDVATVFATGSVMGYAYERTNNLTVPVLLHGIYDASLFLAVFAGLLAF